MAKKKICVIGAGCSGLAATKSCLEEGLDVTCFERDDHIGGIWRYRETDKYGLPSVMKTTVINTSKEISAFSDFPPPESFPNFMHHSMMLKYFERYATHFNLYQHIMFFHDVVNIEKNSDYDCTGRWLVTVKNLEKGTLCTEIFDGVMICSGHHIYPYIPNFEGIEQFSGKVLHTHSLKKVTEFEDQQVLVIGIGNSAVDAAVEISRVAKKVYLSTRRGSWIVPRSVLKGLPYDLIFISRWINILMSWNFFRLLDRSLEFIINNLNFDHKVYGLKPSHHILSAHPTLNDQLSNAIISGKIVVKPNIVTFQHNGVMFENERKISEIDSTVLGTGYEIKFPFLDESILKTQNNRVELYKMVFPPNLNHPSLAFIGLVQPFGPILPITEIQSRWFAYLAANNKELPSKQEMEKEVQSRMLRFENFLVQSPRHTIQSLYISYMDDIASYFDAKPNLFWIAITDPKLFFACWFKACLPYQYRIQGRHSWDGARKVILSAVDRVYTPFKTFYDNDS